MTSALRPTTRSPQMLPAIPLDLRVGHDPRLPDELGAESPDLGLVAESVGRSPEALARLGESTQLHVPALLDPAVILAGAGQRVNGAPARQFSRLRLTILADTGQNRRRRGDAPTGSEEAGMLDWVYTADERDDLPFPCRTVEVYRDEHGAYWLCIVNYRDGRDFDLLPREQYGTGEVGLRVAKAAADGLARGLAVDAQWVVR